MCLSFLIKIIFLLGVEPISYSLSGMMFVKLDNSILLDTDWSTIAKDSVALTTKMPLPAALACWLLFASVCKLFFRC